MARRKKKGTLFGKPKGEVIKHPGAFRAKAKAAGKPTEEYAQEHKHDSGTLGEQARLALNLMGMGEKKPKHTKKEMLQMYRQHNARKK